MCMNKFKNYLMKIDKYQRYLVLKDNWPSHFFKICRKVQIFSRGAQPILKTQKVFKNLYWETC